MRAVPSHVRPAFEILLLERRNTAPWTGAVSASRHRPRCRHTDTCCTWLFDLASGFRLTQEHFGRISIPVPSNINAVTIGLIKPAVPSICRLSSLISHFFRVCLHRWMGNLGRISHVMSPVIKFLCLNAGSTMWTIENLLIGVSDKSDRISHDFQPMCLIEGPKVVVRVG